MDFSFSEAHETIQDLAREILSDKVTAERLNQAEQGVDWYDLSLWSELAQANLTGVGIPEEFGGSGQGMQELCAVLEEIGRTVAPLPAVSTLAMGALPVALFGTPEQQKTYLPGIADGSIHLTGALVEDGGDPLSPTTRATPDGDGFVLDGEKTRVPAVQIAEAVLVPARSEDGVAVFLMDPETEGVEVARQTTTSGEPLFHVVLDGVRVGPEGMLGGRIDGVGVLARLVDIATAAMCAVQVGVTERSVYMTAEYTTERHQFERPLASFQAVQQRLADAYIDVEAMRLVTWQAAWKIDMGADAADEVAIAKFWAADGGQRVLRTAHHLHGGIGVDLSYPLHRYLKRAAENELSLGSATRQLVGIGERMAAR